MTDTQIYYGGAIKDLGNGKVGGYLVVFGDETKTDLEGEFFTPDTDFDLEDTAATSIYYQHGLDPVVKKRSLGKGTIAKRDEVGLWVEAQLKLRDEYEQAIYGMVQAGKMGWSSGTAAHLVERVPAGKSFHITRWPLGLDASITPTPAEPRTQALSLKSIPVFELKRVVDDKAQGQVIPAEDQPEATPEASNGGDAVEADNETVHIEVKEINPMSEEQTQNNTPLDSSDIEARMAAFTKRLEDEFTAKMNHVMETIENSPRLMKSGFYTQDGGEADQGVKSFGDFLLAVKRGDTKRLKSVYKAQTESSATGGGYLVPEQYLNEIVQVMVQQSPIVSRVRRIPVAAPSGMMPGLDQFLTPTAGGGESALSGGVGSNVRAESGSFTEETATFTNIEYRVNDVNSGSILVTRELSEDAPAIEAFLRGLIASAQQSKLEYYILFGSGVGQPLGVLNANNAAAVGVDAATNDAWVMADAMGMLSHFKPMTPNNGVWVIHPSALPDVGVLSNGSGAVAFTPNLQQALPMQLLGAPVVISEHMAQTNNPKDIALVDFSAYYLFERGSAYVEFSEHANFTTRRDTWIFGQRVDGKPALKNRITLADSTGGFYVSPYVYNND